MNLNLLLTEEQFLERSINSPYCFKLEKNNQFLYYFGANHSNDPEDKQNSLLREFFQEFSLISNNREKIVFIESLPIANDCSSEREMIIKHGERGLISFLAKEKNIRCLNIDQTFSEEAIELIKKFELGYVFYYYFVRNVRSWLKKYRNKTFDEILIMSIEDCHKKIGELSKGFDLNLVKKVHFEIFGKELDSSEICNIERAPVPIYEDSIINEIARKSSRLRDENLLRNIEKEWVIGNDVFVVYGFSHSVKEEPVLRELVFTGL